MTRNKIKPRQPTCVRVRERFEASKPLCKSCFLFILSLVRGGPARHRTEACVPSPLPQSMYWVAQQSNDTLLQRSKKLIKYRQSERYKRWWEDNKKTCLTWIIPIPSLPHSSGSISHRWHWHWQQPHNLIGHTFIGPSEAKQIHLHLISSHTYYFCGMNKLNFGIVNLWHWLRVRA